MRKFEKLKKFEGKSVELIYYGTNLPNGAIPPQIIEGKFDSVGKNSCLFLLNQKEEIVLFTEDINIDSVKEI
jgi:hypothetical protein